MYCCYRGLCHRPELKPVSQQILNEIYNAHRYWLAHLPCGVRMVFYHCDLSGLDFSGMDLSGAVICECRMRDAKLTGAHIEDAELVGTDLGTAAA